MKQASVFFFFNINYGIEVDENHDNTSEQPSFASLICTGLCDFCFLVYLQVQLVFYPEPVQEAETAKMVWVV